MMYVKGEDFFSVFNRILDKIEKYYSKSEINNLMQRLSNYWFDDNQWIQDFDDIPKDDLVSLLFSDDFYAKEKD